jgi:hypothetical protein
MPTAAATVATAIQRITTYTHDRRASARLLLAVREDNRHRPLDWCVQATIDQILRDRR